MKTLFANGDSHTAGAELEFGEQITCYEKVWAAHMSKMLGMDYVNISMPGASNYRIFRTTQDWIIENVILNKNYKPDDLTVFVMWSGFDRKEFYFPDTNVIDNVGYSSNVDFYKTGYKKEIATIRDSSVVLHDDLVSCFKSLSLVFNLALFLESYNIKYYFINGIYSFMEPDQANKLHPLFGPYNNLIKMYNKRIKSHIGFYNVDEGYFNYMQNHSGIKIPKHSNYSHYAEDGHIHWAKKVYKFYFEKKLI